MIITGKSRNNAAQAADYLSKQGKNERTELIETRGTLSEDIAGACAEMEAVAAGSKCENFLYHLTINPPEGVTFTPEQWGTATAVAEKKLGLENSQRVIVEHEKKGRVHRHILYNRVDQESIKAVRMGWNYVKHEETAVEIEKLFDLERTPRAFIRDDRTPRANIAPSSNEIEEGKRKGVSVPKWRKECREIVASTNGAGAEIIEALESHGHMVARGDKVAFLLLDPSGTPHRMGGSLGIRKHDFDEIFKGIDPANLPDVATAQEWQKARLADIEKNKAMERGAGLYDRGGMASQQASALQHIKDKAKIREKAANSNEPEKAGVIGKEKPQVQPQQQPEQEPKPRYSQRESLLRDIAPQMHKRATTEQKDSKKEMSAKDAMREVFETNYSRKPSGGGRSQRDKDNDWERERER